MERAEANNLSSNSAGSGYLDRALEALDLSPRSLNALHRGGLERVEDLVQSTRARLLAIPGFGRKGLNEVLDVLKSMELNISEHPVDLLRQRLNRISNEWEDRSARADGQSPYERPSGYLKREVYRLARDLSRAGCDANARALLDKLRGRPARGKAADSLLHALMAAVVTDQQLQRTEKHRYAEELQYALKHKVPVEYLIGFLLQIGPFRRAADRSGAHGYEAWFDQARASCVEECLDRCIGALRVQPQEPPPVSAIQ
jgi:hypothetical protein